MESGSIIAIGLLILGCFLIYVFKPEKKINAIVERPLEVESVQQNINKEVSVVKKKQVRKKKEISESGEQKEGGESKQ